MAMRCWCASRRLVLGFVTKDIDHAFSGRWAATVLLLLMLNGFSIRKRFTNRRNRDERNCVYGSEKAKARHSQRQFAGRDYRPFRARGMEDVTGFTQLCAEYRRHR